MVLWHLKLYIMRIHLLFCGAGTEIILSMPLASRLPAQEQAKHSQILFLSLSSHLGNGNLYLQSVGAGGEHEILKSTSLYSPPPSFPGLSGLSLPTPPLTLFIGEMLCEAACQLCIPWFCESNIPPANVCGASHAASFSSEHCLHSLPDTTSDRWWHEAEKHQFFWILTLMHCQTKKKNAHILGGGGTWETNEHCSDFHNMCWHVVTSC